MPLTSRTLSAALAALLIAAPAAAASTQDLRSPDVRDAAAATTTQDLRSPDTRDAANRAQAPTSSLAGTTSPEPNSGRTSANVYVPPAAAFTDTVAPGHGSAEATRSAPSHTSAGLDWTSIAFALAGSLLAIGVAAGITTRRRARPAT